MAEEIGNIIDADEAVRDLNKVVESIVKLEAEIDKCNSKSLNIEVDARNLKSLSDVIELQKELQQQVSSMNQTLGQNAVAMELAQQAAIRMGEAAAAATNQQGQAAQAGAQHVQELINRIAVLQGLLERTPAGSSGFQNISARVAELQRQLSALQSPITGTTTGLNNNAGAANNAAGGLGNLGRSAGGAALSVGKLVESLATGFTSFIESKIMEGVNMLLESMWNKLTGTTEATIKAKAALDEYNKSMDEYRKNKITDAGDVVANIFFKRSEADSQLKIMQDMNKTVEQQFTAYKRLQGIYPDLFDSMDLEGFKHAKNSERMQTQIGYMNEYSILQEKIAKGREDEKSSRILLGRTDTQLGELQKTFLEDWKSSHTDIFTKKQFGKQPTLDEINNMAEHTSLPDDLPIAANSWAKALSQIHKVLNNKKELEKNIEQSVTLNAQHESEKAALEGNDQMKKEVKNIKDSKEPQEPKKKPSKHKEMTEAIEEEKARYEGDVLKAKTNYNGKNNEIGADATMVHKKQLAKEEKDAAELHYTNLKKILDDYHGKVGESEAKFETREQQAANDLARIKNAITEEEKKNAEELQKIHQEEDRKREEALDKFNKQAEELQTIAGEIEDIKKKSAVDSKYAHGINPILEGLGIAMPDSQTEKKRDIDIDAAKRKGATASKNLADEQKKTLPDTTKMADFKKDIADSEKSVAMLEADRQASIDEKIIKGKKRVAELSIEFARSAMDAINTIRNNGFAKEQQQLQIQQQKLQTTTQQKIQAIQATTNFQIAKDNQIAKITAQSQAQQNALQQKQNELALKKAKADKQAAQAGIILKTAVAIAGVLPLLADPLTIPIGIAQIALITATGAVQYAAAASAPLPQFEKGGTTATPRFIAGEKGAELGVTPSGKTMLFEKPGIYTAPIGTHIKNAADTERLIRYAINGIGYNGMSVAALVQKPGGDITTKKIEDKLDELTDATIQAAMMGRSIKNNLIINIKNDLQRPR